MPRQLFELSGRFWLNRIFASFPAGAMRYATYASMRTDALLPLDMERVSGFAVAISGETTEITVTESVATADEAGEEADAESAAAKVYTAGDTTLDSEKVHSMRSFAGLTFQTN